MSHHFCLRFFFQKNLYLVTSSAIAGWSMNRTANERSSHPLLFQPKQPYPYWDYNWDNRMRPHTTEEKLATSNGFEASRARGVTRHILLVRHGQYHEEHQDDVKRTLTKLGQRQAHLTGRRLQEWRRGGHGLMHPDFAGPCHFKAIHVSDMKRAKETAAIISTHLPGVEIQEPDPILNEALPALMIPTRPDISNAEKEIAENHDRIESAFQKYIHRANDDDDCERRHEFEVIVCHGNVIRYFLCRALQLPPEAWLRMSTFNCSITYLVVAPNGYCSARMMGDVGHLSYDETTFSGFHGFRF